MKTTITFRFVLAPLDMNFVGLVLAAAGINDAVIYGTEQDGNTVSFTANRHLTDAEIVSVKAAFLSALIDIKSL